MPELPDIAIYIESLEKRVLGRPLEEVRIASPFLLRSVEPPIARFKGRRIEAIRRIGKRIVFDCGEELYLVLHLMIAGRLHWRDRGAPLARKVGLAAFDFPNGTLVLTEASPKKRASLHAVSGRAALDAHDPGGIEILDCAFDDFRRALLAENHTLKRTLADPRVLSGIGNAYSDEILHRARLSPIKMTRSLGDEEIARLHTATRETLAHWIALLRKHTGEAFPEKVTAFRPEMAVHGRYGKPCPDCGAPVQRIVYSGNETNYCARCQTGGRVLADRALSRLLKSDWPRTLEEMEERRRSAS
jgi:formamidopyrimidine-DNA glycosylase